MQKSRWWVTALPYLLLSVGVAATVWAIWKVPPMIAADDGAGQLSAERLQAIASVRQAMLFAAGGLIAIITLVFTWHRDRVARMGLELDRDANFTRRYTEAVAHLGSDSLAIRLGGIYALERIARDADLDREGVVSVIAAWLRHERSFSASPLPSLPVDAAAAVSALGRIRRTAPVSNGGEILRATLPPDVAAALTARRGFRFIRLDLSRTVLDAANLRGADLRRAVLYNVSLRGADLRHALLSGADLTGADLAGADLRGALLDGTNLTAAEFHGANLSGAKLSGSILDGANLRFASMHKAELTLDTRFDESTRWPDGLVPPDPKRLGLRWGWQTYSLVPRE